MVTITMINLNYGQRIGMLPMKKTTISMLPNKNHSSTYQVNHQTITIKRTIHPSLSSPILVGNSQTLENHWNQLWRIFLQVNRLPYQKKEIMNLKSNLISGMTIIFAIFIQTKDTKPMVVKDWSILFKTWLIMELSQWIVIKQMNHI